MTPSALHIAAVSIVAEAHPVIAGMAEQEAIHPGHGFARHKGYGTAAASCRMCGGRGYCTGELCAAELSRARSDQEVVFPELARCKPTRRKQSEEAVPEPTHDRRRASGRQGEDLAAAYLAQRGDDIITR